MPNPGFSGPDDPRLVAAGEAYARLGRYDLVAAELGWSYSKAERRAKAWATWQDAPQGQRDAIRHSGMDIGTVKGGWIKTGKDENGISHSVRWTAPADDATTSLADSVRAAFEGMDRAVPVPAPAHADDDLLTIYPIADAHIGMMAWGKETGEAYKTDIAVARLKSWMGKAVAASPASGRAVILDVGDLTHADDQKNQTPQSKHILDVDTRHFRTIDATIAALAHVTDAALQKHKQVTVIILPGNHNPTAYMVILFAMFERYANEPRVTVRKEPGEFWVEEFGVNMVAAHHGDKAPPQRLVLWMADDHAAIWGRTLHRFLWTGHKHHTKAEDIGGVQWEQLRALTAKDAYAASNAYSARAQLQAITLHRTEGEIIRCKVNG